MLLQKTLHLPVVKRDVHIDYTGATLIVAGVSLLLVWVSLAGNQFDWVSPVSALLVVAGLVVVAAAVYVEARVAVEPVVPLRLFRDRTIALATTASVLIGVAMFGSTVYLSQYFQTARGMSPTAAGLMSICMVGGLLVSSIVSGRRITTHRTWKRWLVSGMVLTVVGLGLLGTIDETTDLRVVGLFMAVLGVGLGATMQNLVLAVQNNVPLSELGAASSVVAFFRSLGGSVGVSALGALLSTQVAAKVTAGLSDLGVEAGRPRQPRDPRPRPRLPAPVRAVFEQAFGESFGHLFLVATPLAVLALVCVRGHPRGAAAHHPRHRPGGAGRLRARGHRRPGRGRRGRRDPRGGYAAATMTASRAESLMRLEQEVGVMIRRVKRVIGERAHAVHPDLQPASYLMLAYLGQHGPMRASAAAEMFNIDKGAISRQVAHLVDLGLVERTPGPRRRPRLADLGHRDGGRAADRGRRAPAPWLDERLGDWDAEELEEFARVLGRYNEALNRG